MAGTTTCSTCGQANAAESEYCVRCGTRMPDPSSTQLVGAPGSGNPEYPWEPPAEWDPGELPATGGQPPARTWVGRGSDQVGQVGWNTGRDTGAGGPWGGPNGQAQAGYPATPPAKKRSGKKPIFIGVGAVVVVAAVVLAILLATGGKKKNGDSALNGVQNQNGTEALTTTRVALRDAKSTHLTGTVKSDSQAIQVDLTLAGSNSQGTLTINNNDVQLIKLGDTVYIKGDQDFLKQYAGSDAAVLNALNGKWLKTASSSDFDAFSIDGFANVLKGGSAGKSVNAKVDRSTLNGKPIVVISQSDGSTLSVANTGPAYPLVVDSKSGDGGQVSFSDYNKAVTITAPPASEVVDVDAAGTDSTPTPTPTPSASLSSDDIAGSYVCKPDSGSGGGTLYLNSDFSYTLKNTDGSSAVGGSWGSSGDQVAFAGGSIDKYTATVLSSGDLKLRGAGTNSSVSFTCS